MQREDRREERLRGAEVRHLFEEDRHVEMHAPFGARCAAGFGERLRQVDEPAQRAIGPLHHLVQIHGFGEGGQMPRAFPVERRHLERGAELQLGDQDAVGA